MKIAGDAKRCEVEKRNYDLCQCYQNIKQNRKIYTPPKEEWLRIILENDGGKVKNLEISISILALKIILEIVEVYSAFNNSDIVLKALCKK